MNNTDICEVTMRNDSRIIHHTVYKGGLNTSIRIMYPNGSSIQVFIKYYILIDYIEEELYNDD